MNGGAMGDVAHALLEEILRETAGVTLRPRPEPVEGASGGDRSTQTGTYRRASATYVVVERGDDGLVMTVTNTSDLAEVIAAEPVEVDLLPVREDLYVGRLPGSTTWTPAVFFALPDGARYLHFGARATQRVDAVTSPAEDLHRAAVVADTHNDLLMAVAARPTPVWGSFFAERWLPQLRAGGVDLQVLPVFVDDDFRPEGALRQTLRMVECAHRIAEANPDDVALCVDGVEIARALESGRIALVLALESAPGVDADVELLGTLFRLGVRVASLAHFGRTPLADGSAEDATGSRLTRAGVEAVALMERLGMVYDVSHLGHSAWRTSWRSPPGRSWPRTPPRERCATTTATSPTSTSGASPAPAAWCASTSSRPSCASATPRSTTSSTTSSTWSPRPVSSTSAWVPTSCRRSSRT